MIGQIPYPGAAGMAGLGGFWSSVASVAKTAAQVAVLPVTASLKTITAPARALNLPGASTADRIVSSATLNVVNKALNYVADKETDAACTLLMNKYVAAGAAAGLAVATSGGSLVIAQGGQIVATGLCAKKIADEMAKKQAAEDAAKLAALQQGNAANAILNANSFPAGSIAYKQPDGMYRIAIPKGLGDIGATTHVEVAIVTTKPNVLEVDKPTYTKATKPLYLQTSFLIGASLVALLVVGGVSFATYKKKHKK